MMARRDVLDGPARWLNDPVSVCEGLILSISALRRVIHRLNGKHGRWWIEDPLVVHKIDHLNIPDLAMIQVFHARTAPDQVTDELGLMLPVIGAPTKTDCALVCLAPELIRFAMEGLYVEAGHVQGDVISDFERIWKPLKCAVIEVGIQEGTIW